MGQSTGFHTEASEPQIMGRSLLVRTDTLWKPSAQEGSPSQAHLTVARSALSPGLWVTFLLSMALPIVVEAGALLGTVWILDQGYWACYVCGAIPSLPQPHLPLKPSLALSELPFLLPSLPSAQCPAWLFCCSGSGGASWECEVPYRRIALQEERLQGAVLNPEAWSLPCHFTFVHRGLLSALDKDS